MNHTGTTITATVASAIAVTVALGALAGSAGAGGGDRGGGRHRACRGMEHLSVPGAERLEAACLSDLTTAGTVQTGHTDPVDFAGLNVPGTVNPTGVPGIQLDGYFPDTSSFNTTHGWNHDAQFVIRMPREWNGGLVVSGPPGTRRQYASDVIISDPVLAQGYAYASTDKGNNGLTIYQDGVEPGDAIEEWNARVTELTIAAKQVVEQRYHRAPERTYIAGFSAAGYLTRWQLENRPDLYDGGIDWSGLMITPERSLLTYLPTALTEYPKYVAGSAEAHQALIDAGFPAGSEPIWEFSYRSFWDPLQRTLREELDPTFDGDTQAGHPFCAPGSPDCDADYDLDTRPPEVVDAFTGIALTGRIGKPLITLQGTLDTANRPAESQLYAAMIEAQGRGAMARMYEVEGGSHFEGLYVRHPDLLRPMLPCFRAAFEALEQWTLSPRRSPAPASHFVPRDPSADLVNTCEL
jgi:hypothetical protein